MINIEKYYDDCYYGHFDIRKDIVSSCCNMPVHDIMGSYDDIGRILNGYTCTKCFKHLFKLSHFNLGK